MRIERKRSEETKRKISESKKKVKNVQKKKKEDFRRYETLLEKHTI